MRVTLVSTAFALLSVIILALVYLATGTSAAVTATLSFAGGVSNIFLPYTLSLAFIIVPLSTAHGYMKGFIMSLLFGLGLIITFKHRQRASTRIMGMERSRLSGPFSRKAGGRGLRTPR